MLWSGCDEIELPKHEHQPRRCVLMVDPGASATISALQAWVPSSVTSPMAELGDQRLALDELERIDSGHGFTVHPRVSGHLTLSGQVEGKVETLLELEIMLRPRAAHRLKKALDEVLGDPSAQRALEQRWRQQRAATESPWEKLQYTQHLQFVNYDLGQWEESAALAMEAAHIAQDQGWILTECNSTWSAAFVYGQQIGDKTQALEVLDRSCRYAESIPQVAMMEGYYRGMLQLDGGQLWNARRTIEQGLDLARRLRWYAWERMFTLPLVDALAEQGRFAWAKWLLRRSQELAELSEIGVVQRCAMEVMHFDLRGQLAYREARLTGRPSDAARLHWERATEISTDSERCPDHAAFEKAAAALPLRLARLDLDEQDVAGAERRLDRVDPASLIPFHALLLRLLRAELLLAKGRLTHARRALDELAQDLDPKSDSMPRPQDRWRYFLLQAQLWRAQRRPQQAIDTLAMAQRELLAGIGAPGAGVETDRYVAMRRQSGQLLVRVLLEQGQIEPALCAARITRARVQIGPRLDPEEVSPVEASLRKRLAAYEWYDPRDIPVDELMEIESGLSDLMSVRPMAQSVRCEDLPSPAPGEVSLLPFDDGLHALGFAWDHTGRVVARPLAGTTDVGDPAAVGRALLTPFEDLLSDATRLRVLMPPALHDVDVTNLPWKGRPLGESMAVAHAIDLPTIPRQIASQPAAALVFSDPRARLLDDRAALGAHFEDWAAHLREGGLRIIDHSPSANEGHVSIDDVLGHTEDAQLAILYGFGATHRSRYKLRSSASIEEDADQGTFDLGATGLLRTDVLRRSGRVPQHVILAHCDSAKVDPYGISGAVGLAQSYVQAGSEWAVGTEGTVNPETMKVVVDELLDAYVESPSVESIAGALHRLGGRLRVEGFPDGEKLRLWIP